MATRRKKDEDAGMVGRLAGRGEEAVTRLMDELGRNRRVTDALGKALSAKGKLDSASRSALGTVGLAPADEVNDLRKQLERVERRLAKLETGGGRASTGGRSAKQAETKKAPTAKKGTSRSKAGEGKKPSPAPGRAIGGGTGRASGPGAASS